MSVYRPAGSSWLRRLIPHSSLSVPSAFDLSIMVLLLLAFVGMTMAIDYHV